MSITKDVLEVLVTNGANINAKSNVCSTPLVLGARYGQYEALKFMLEHTIADTSVRAGQGSTTLHIAALYGHSSCTKILLEHSPPQIVNSKEYSLGATPLHWACQTGDYDSVVSILSYGPFMSYDNQGLSALHTAAAKNHDKIVEVMVQEHGWDKNIVSSTFYLLLSQHVQLDLII